jgi:kynurenine formamidase
MKAGAPDPGSGAALATLERLCASVSNWDRWGPQDEIGTLNYITPAKIIEAARLIKTGRITELGIPLDRNGPQLTAPRRYNPIHLMDRLAVDSTIPGGGEVGVSDDVLVLPLQSATQWDSLAHVAYRGRLYGGRDAATVTTRGASVNSIKAISSKVMSRGVLVDLARHAGLDSLAPGKAITPEDLDATLVAQKVQIGRGDVLLVRTGFLGRCRAAAWQGFHGESPGLGLDTVRWIHDHELAAVASDTAALEVKPWNLPGVASPFHVAALVHMGLLIGEIFDLDALAAECAADGVYEFLFVAPPLPVTGGVGSVINPYAVK